MSGYWGNGEANTMLANRLTNRAGPLYLALHTAEPGRLFDTSTEVNGMAYARQPISFADPSGQAVVSNDNQAFPGLPACVLSWYSVQSALVGSALVFAGQIPGGIVITRNQMLLVAAGDIAFRFP